MQNLILAHCSKYYISKSNEWKFCFVRNDLQLMTTVPERNSRCLCIFLISTANLQKNISSPTNNCLNHSMNLFTLPCIWKDLYYAKFYNYTAFGPEKCNMNTYCTSIYFRPILVWPRQMTRQTLKRSMQWSKWCRILCNVKKPFVLGFHYKDLLLCIN